MQTKKSTWYLWLIVLAGAWVAMGTPGLDSLPSLPSLNSKVTQATYVYDARKTAVPAGVSAGLQKLNAAGILATTFEDGTVDGTGETPEQYKVAQEAATKHGPPCIVTQRGEKVWKVYTGVKTEAEILDAAQ